MAKKQYVLGFMLSRDGYVALIRKKRPAWQAGMWNGVGGSVEGNESWYDAMVREANEETGIDTRARAMAWVPFAELLGPSDLRGNREWEVQCFACDAAECHDNLELVQMTDEEVAWHPIEKVLDGTVKAIPNVRAYLLELAAASVFGGDEFFTTVRYKK